LNRTAKSNIPARHKATSELVDLASARRRGYSSGDDRAEPRWFAGEGAAGPTRLPLASSPPRPVAAKRTMRRHDRKTYVIPLTWPARKPSTFGCIAGLRGEKKARSPSAEPVHSCHTDPIEYDAEIRAAT
jgi:hypothetical protein